MFNINTFSILCILFHLQTVQEKIVIEKSVGEEQDWEGHEDIQKFTKYEAIEVDIVPAEHNVS